MNEEFTILSDPWLWRVIMKEETADELFHLLGGKKTHTVFLTQIRNNSWNSSERSGCIDSCEMLARDKFGFCHSMTIRIIDDLGVLLQICDNPFGDVWTYEKHGVDVFCRPVTQVRVYFLRSKLPGDALSCKVGFPLIPDDLELNVAHPTLAISTEVDDGSELSKLVQYLKKPFVDHTAYGALSERISILVKSYGK